MTDHATGRVAHVHNPLGTFASGGIVDALPDPLLGLPRSETLPTPPGSPGLLLHDRFRAHLVTTDGGTVQGTRVPLTDDSGAFWLTDARNLEVLVKVVDGRALNGHWWLFVGSASNRAFALTVEDLQTGTVHTIENPEGSFLGHVDLDAFTD